MYSPSPGGKRRLPAQMILVMHQYCQTRHFINRGHSTLHLISLGGCKDVISIYISSQQALDGKGCQQILRGGPVGGGHQRGAVRVRIKTRVMTSDARCSPCFPGINGAQFLIQSRVVVPLIALVMAVASFATVHPKEQPG
jgi:hypothetical protein